MARLQVADDQPLKQMLLTQHLLPDLKPLVETVSLTVSLTSPSLGS